MSPPFSPRRTLRSASELVAAGLVPASDEAALARVGQRYAVAVPPALADVIDPADPDDPIARQVIPSVAELEAGAGERADPIGDERFSPVKGIVHRYPDRVLLKPLHTCPLYCRFCFRREMVGGAGGVLTPAELEAALAYVAGHGELREVILTGGDPLMLSAARLGGLVERLAAMPHLDVVRVHSRVPVATPERITPELVRALTSLCPGNAAVWLAVHVNHPRELSPAVCAALADLTAAGVPLLSQTVLLKGVNADPAVLEALFRTLVRNRVRPYYLHHPDLAPGTAHFRPTIAEGQAIVRALRGRLSGIAQPTYVLDIPGGAGKVPVGPEYWDEAEGLVTDWTGATHRYEG